jgi:hypothetical protein
MGEVTFLVLVIALLVTALGLLQSQVYLLNQRIDHLWEYSRSLSRSHEAQGRINRLIAARVGFVEEENTTEQEATR